MFAVGNVDTTDCFQRQNRRDVLPVLRFFLSILSDCTGKAAYNFPFLRARWPVRFDGIRFRVIALGTEAKEVIYI